MKKFTGLFGILSLILNISSYANISDEKPSYLDITQLGHEQYQDIVINGEVIQHATHNHKDCDTRYQIINTVLSIYNRPFTMLDIGASQGYYSLRAALSYPESVFVMLEGNNKHYPLSGSQLLDICKANTSLNNIVLLNKALNLEDAQRLSECENFDVVLALNIIHWFGESWKEITNIILNMGSNIIIETPPQETIVSQTHNHRRKEIEEYLLSKNAQVIGKVPRHTSDVMTTLYLIQTNKGFLERKTWLMPLLKEKTHLIESNFDYKKLHKKVNSPPDTYQSSDWLPGINLVTFKMYNGTYPTAPMLKDLLSHIRDKSHNDWMINNMILQGNWLQLIDLNDPTHNPGGPGGGNNALIKEIYDNHCTLMDISEPLKVEHYFWHYLIRLPIKNRSRNKFVRAFIRKNDLVFDIGASEGTNTQLYVSHHAKVISIESDIKKLHDLHVQFDSNDQITIVAKQVTDKKDHSETEISLQELIAIYGAPDYCSLNVENSKDLALQLSMPIKCISFPFSMTDTRSIEECIQHLASLGYRYFNFSCRQIPLYMLTEWQNHVTMVDEIKECSQKDHEGNLLWGYVYAQMDNSRFTTY